MSAADTLRRFRSVGFTLTTDGVTLFVSPRERLTDDDRDELRYFKPDILALLAREGGGEPRDGRVRCVDCRHYSSAAHRCANYRSALLMGPEVGPDLAALPQHCYGFDVRPATRHIDASATAGRESHH